MMSILDSFPDFDTVALATDADFRSIRFIGGGLSFRNSVFYDNITATVPEPATLALLGAAMLRDLTRLGLVCDRDEPLVERNVGRVRVVIVSQIQQTEMPRVGGREPGDFDVVEIAVGCGN
jgi:hypothetical protein